MGINKALQHLSSRALIIMKKLLPILTAVVTSAFLIFSLGTGVAMAQEQPAPTAGSTSVNPSKMPDFGLGAAASLAFGRELKDVPPEVIIGQIILALLGFVGLIFLILTIYAGFLWMTAGGNDDKVKKSKQIIVSAVIGMIIIFSSYALASFFLQQVTTTVVPSTPGATTP